MDATIDTFPYNLLKAETTMKLPFLLSITAALCLSGTLQQGHDPCLSRSADLYPAGNAMFLLNICKSEFPGSMGNLDNAVATWGDGASISILKLLDAEELATPENTKAYLCLVRKAFYDSAKIWRKADRSPNVTVFLLDYLEQKHLKNVPLRKEIESVRRYIRERANPFG